MTEKKKVRNTWPPNVDVRDQRLIPGYVGSWVCRVFTEDGEICNNETFLWAPSQADHEWCFYSHSYELNKDINFRVYRHDCFEKFSDGMGRIYSLEQAGKIIRGEKLEEDPETDEGEDEEEEDDDWWEEGEVIPADHGGAPQYEPPPVPQFGQDISSEASQPLSPQYDGDPFSDSGPYVVTDSLNELEWQQERQERFFRDENQQELPPTQASQVPDPYYQAEYDAESQPLDYFYQKNSRQEHQELFFPVENQQGVPEAQPPQPIEYTNVDTVRSITSSEELGVSEPQPWEFESYLTLKQPVYLQTQNWLQSEYLDLDGSQTPDPQLQQTLATQTQLWSQPVSLPHHTIEYANVEHNAAPEQYGLDAGSQSDQQPLLHQTNYVTQDGYLGSNLTAEMSQQPTAPPNLYPTTAEISYVTEQGYHEELNVLGGTGAYLSLEQHPNTSPDPEASPWDLEYNPHLNNPRPDLEEFQGQPEGTPGVGAKKRRFWRGFLS